MSVRLIVVDTETGGFDPAESCIIELAAKHVIIAESVGKVVADELHFHALIKPDRPVNPGAAAVNGYTEEKWQNAMEMNDAATAFWVWLDAFGDDLTWAGSNVSGFDLPFLKSDFERAGVQLPGKPKFGRRLLNTESLCFPLLVAGEVDGCGIQELRNWAGVEGEQHHTALGDVDDTITVIRTYFERKVWQR